MERYENLAELPAAIPVFPLSGVLLLPGGPLPLNIFEKRYLAMVDDALRGSRLIAMVQPQEEEGGTLFSTGCAGRISAFEETGDGRYLITLTGVCRFRIAQELPPQNGYRRIVPDWTPYEKDLRPESCIDLDRERLKTLLGDYFSMNHLSCDWDAIDGADDYRLITCLSMICPLEAKEKQALLEAECCRARAALFITMLEMAVRKGSSSCCGGGCH